MSRASFLIKKQKKNVQTQDGHGCLSKKDVRRLEHLGYPGFFLELGDGWVFKVFGAP